ncbi:MAG: hypothetical protein NT076_04670 [Candidatus Pacearchaeota archaeon]|nr:hypothetical protein [Candidatus Pacearchaeota archaeon]
MKKKFRGPKRFFPLSRLNPSELEELRTYLEYIAVYTPGDTNIASELLPQLPHRRYISRETFDYIRDMTGPVLADAGKRRNWVLANPQNPHSYKTNEYLATIRGLVTAGDCLSKFHDYIAAPAGAS